MSPLTDPQIVSVCVWCPTFTPVWLRFLRRCPADWFTLLNRCGTEMERCLMVVTVRAVVGRRCRVTWIQGNSFLTFASLAKPKKSGERSMSGDPSACREPCERCRSPRQKTSSPVECTARRWRTAVDLRADGWAFKIKAAAQLVSLWISSAPGLNPGRFAGGGLTSSA